MRRIATATFVFVLTFGLAAQQPRLPAPTPLGTARGVFSCDGHLVALGANYKARFHTGEVEFVPAFGRAAARNHALRLGATGMARGGATVPFAAVAAERRGQDAVGFARAPGVTEVFTAMERGLEQSFVLAYPPAGTGDLVVTCTLQCDVAGVADEHGGLRFEVPEAGPFTIGAVTGIDANGWRVPGAMRLDGTTLALSLPADFVDHAAYPLVLDPLLSGPTLLSGLDRQDQDVVHDPATGDWLAVWATYVSASDADVYAQRVSQATGSPVGGVFPIDASTSSTESPKVAAVRATGRVLVAYRTNGLLTPNRIWGRTVQVVTATVSLATQIGSGVDNNFALASEDTTADNEALVVWGGGTEVRAAQVTVNATGAPVASASVAITTTSNDPFVAISKTNGGTGNYLIAWRPAAFILLPPVTTLVCVLVTRNLTILTPVHTIDAAATGVPAVDCSGGRYLVTYARFEPNSTVNRDVMCAAILYFGAFGVLSTIDGPLPVEATSGQDEAGPDVAWLGQRFGVTFTENAGAANENAAGWLIDTDCTPCSTRMTLTGVSLSGFTQKRQPRIASRAHFVAGAEDGEVAFVQDNPTTPHPVVVGQRVVGVGPGGAVTSLGGGCGQGGLATATPNGFALGNTDCRFEVGALAAGALPLCCLGVPATTIPCGTCTFLNSLAAFYEPNVAGAASHSFVVPCDPIYIGFQMEVQWVSLLTTASPCPLVPGLSASNRVRFTVGP